MLLLKVSTGAGTLSSAISRTQRMTHQCERGTEARRRLRANPSDRSPLPLPLGGDIGSAAVVFFVFFSAAVLRNPGLRLL